MVGHFGRWPCRRGVLLKNLQLALALRLALHYLLHLRLNTLGPALQLRVARKRQLDRGSSSLNKNPERVLVLVRSLPTLAPPAGFRVVPSALYLPLKRRYFASPVSILSFLASSLRIDSMDESAVWPQDQLAVRPVIAVAYLTLLPCMAVFCVLRTPNSFEKLRNLSVVRILILATMVDSFIFVWGSAVLLFGVGSSFSNAACSVSRRSVEMRP